MSSDDSDVDIGKIKLKVNRAIISDDEDEIEDRHEFTNEPNSQDNNCEAIFLEIKGPNVSGKNEEDLSVNVKKTMMPFKSSLITASGIESDDDGSLPGDGNSVLKSKNFESTDSECNEDVHRPDLDFSSNSKAKNVALDHGIVSAKKPKLKKKKTSNLHSDEKLKIISERQRLSREMPVNLPYHRPKQRSLKEFLSRTRHEIPMSCLRSTHDKMIEKWTKIDEDIKQVSNFFKPDSENDDSDGDQDNSVREIDNNSPINSQKSDRSNNELKELSVNLQESVLDLPDGLVLDSEQNVSNTASDILNKCSDPQATDGADSNVPGHTMDPAVRDTREQCFSSLATDTDIDGQEECAGLQAIAGICTPEQSNHQAMDSVVGNSPAKCKSGPAMASEVNDDPVRCILVKEVVEKSREPTTTTSEAPEKKAGDEVLNSTVLAPSFVEDQDSGPQLDGTVHSDCGGQSATNAMDPKLQESSEDHSLTACDPNTNEERENNVTGNAIPNLSNINKSTPHDKSHPDENQEAESGMETIEEANTMAPNHSAPASSKVENWLESIIALEKRDSLRKQIKAMTNQEVLNIVPTLSRQPDDFIDLDDDNESSTLKSGAKELMDRLFKASRPSCAGSSVELTTSSTQLNESGGIDGILVEKIVLESNPKTEDDRPGYKLQRLREKLKKDIEAKWEEEYKKRCAEQSFEQKEGYENDVDEEVELDEEAEISSSGESEPEEEDIILDDKPRKECAFGDSEAEESDGEADDEGGDDGSSIGGEREDSNDSNSSIGDNPEDEDVENQNSDPQDDVDMDCSLPAFQPGGGLLHGGSTLTQQSQPLPFQPFSPTSSPAVPRLNSKWKMNDSIVDDENTPVKLSIDENLDVSPSVKKALFEPSDVIGSSKNLFPIDDNADDPFQFVSGVFPEDEPGHSQPLTMTRRIILPDDSDDGQEDAVDNAPYSPQAAADETVKSQENKLTSPGLIIGNDDVVTLKKMKKRLAFSDDEDAEDDGDIEDKDNADGADSENEDDVSESGVASAADDYEENDDAEGEDGPVEYDSEENEVVRAPVNPKEFLEHEAELSESEWSGDEDELGLDMLDAEAGDADLLDEDQVQSQLGKIHMRRMLDQDARDVRLLQELLFEDGDLHTDGKKRDRKFKWKNLTGFDRLDERAVDGSESEGEGEQTETELAKLRHERAQWILQLQKEGKEVPSSAETVDEDPLLQLGRQLLQRVRNKPSDKAEVNPTAPRGSFLMKGTNFLSRISRLAGGAKEGPLGPKNSRNFVFHAQSPVTESTTVVAEEASVSIKVVKRKAVGAEREEAVKKLKLVQASVTRSTLLDQLD